MMRRFAGRAYSRVHAWLTISGFAEIPQRVTGWWHTDTQTHNDIDNLTTTDRPKHQ
jgi:hypothetical protein